MTPTFPPSPAQGETAGVSELPIKLREAADRILNHCFNKSGDSALVSIPADRSRDVDLLLFEAADQLEVARQQLAELREANAAALRVSLIHTATHEIAKVREERDEAREAVEDIEKERDKLLQQLAEMRVALECATTLHIDEPGREGPDLHPLRAHGWNPSKETGPMFVARLARKALAPTSQPSRGKCACCGIDLAAHATGCALQAHPGNNCDCGAQPERGKCETCGGLGEVGGHLGQTPESFEYVTEPCPDCAQPERQEVPDHDQRKQTRARKVSLPSPPQDDIVAGLRRLHDDMRANGMLMAMPIVKQAIAVLGEKGWIPVSEKHAPLYKDILVQDKNGHPSVSRYMGHGAYTHDRYPVLGQCKAVAWRELPDAYVPSPPIGRGA